MRRPVRGFTLVEILVASSLFILFTTILVFFLSNLLPGARDHLRAMHRSHQTEAALRKVRMLVESSEQRGLSVDTSSASSSVLAVQPVLHYDSGSKKVWAQAITVFWLSDSGLRFRRFEQAELAALGVNLDPAAPTPLSASQLTELVESGPGLLLVDGLSGFEVSTDWESSEPRLRASLHDSSEFDLVLRVSRT